MTRTLQQLQAQRTAEIDQCWAMLTEQYGELDPQRQVWLREAICDGAKNLSLGATGADERAYVAHFTALLIATGLNEVLSRHQQRQEAEHD